MGLQRKLHTCGLTEAVGWSFRAYTVSRVVTWLKKLEVGALDSLVSAAQANSKEKMSFKKIVVVGLGYIGLPTAAMFASRKIDVLGVDVNAHAVDTINAGNIHIVEPDLDTLVHDAVKEGYLSASLIAEAADAFLLAVPTPFKGNNEPDLSYIETAARSIAPVLKKGDLVILESTSPVGATEQLSKWLANARPDLSFPLHSTDIADVNVAHCPERVLPGYVVKELVENDRVIGGITPRCSQRCLDLYKVFVKGECVVTNARTAEMAKLTENASRDVGIAFANELSLICDRLDIDVWELIRLANRHPRVEILQPGPGVGGHCIAVDPWFIVSSARDEARLIHTAREVNDSKPNWVVDKVKAAIADFLNQNPTRTLESLVVACFGVAFKPDIDDLRESPALEITKRLVTELPGKVHVVEPNVSELLSHLQSNAELLETDKAIANSDILVLLVDHKEFKEIQPSSLSGKVIIDTRGIWT